MNCPDMETLLGVALSNGEKCNVELAEHIRSCVECRKNLRIVNESILAEDWGLPKNDCAIGEVMRMVGGMGFDAATDKISNGFVLSGERYAPTELYIPARRRIPCERFSRVRWSSAVRPLRRARFQSAAFLTRGLNDSGLDELGDDLSFIKRGKNCALRVKVERQESDDVVVKIALLNGDENSVLSFNLTIVDGENKNMLLADRMFDKGEAILKGVEKGVYLIKAVHGDQSCKMTLEIG